MSSIILHIMRTFSVVIIGWEVRSPPCHGRMGSGAAACKGLGFRHSSHAHLVGGDEKKAPAVCKAARAWLKVVKVRH